MKKTAVLSKQVRTTTSLIELGEDQIMKVTFLPGSVLTAKSLREDHEAYTQLSRRKAYPFIFIAEKDVEFTLEARNFAPQLSPKYITAVAVVVGNFAYRVLAEFFYGINRPPMPYKVFSKMEDALDWIRLYS